MFEGFPLERPLFLIALGIPVLLVWRARRSGPPDAFPFSSSHLLDARAPTARERLRRLPDLLRLVSLTLLGLALAGPDVVRSIEQVEPGGLDILLLIDASRSMLAQDLTPNRFGAAKQLAERLVAARPRDRFGLMTFAGRAAGHVPLTRDHAALVKRLREVAPLDHEEGTALGVAVADGLRQLQPSARRPSTVVLLTDGASNAGAIAPDTAGSIAAGLNVHVYALGLGGSAPAPYPSEFGLLEIELERDDGTLEQLTARTGGAYIPSATDRAFERLSHELDRIDPQPDVVTVRDARISTFRHWVAAALACLFIELALRATYLRTFP